MARSSEDALQTRWSLIQRLKNRDDQESWRDFFNIYWRLIYNVAMKAGLSDAEAQDVVQETVLGVYKRIEEFRADAEFGSFKSWLLTQTRWRIEDQRRKTNRDRQRFVSMEPRDADSSVTPPIARIPDPAGDALEAMWEAEWGHNLLEVALDRVKLKVQAQHFQVFHLYGREEKPAQQVAAAFGLSVDNVHLIKHRVEKILVRTLEEVECEMRQTGVRDASALRPTTNGLE